MLSLFRGNLRVMIGFMFMMSGTATYDRLGSTSPIFATSAISPVMG
jgi:hypothetical protein